MPYRFILTDLAGVELSELPGALNKTATVPVVGMGTSSVAVRGDTDDAELLLGGDRLLRVIEQRPGLPDVMLAHHRLITFEEVAGEGGHTVSATFADGIWTLMRRLCGKSVDGYSRGTALAPVDPGLIITELVDATNAESPSGVRMGPVTASTPTYVAGWRYKPVGEAVAELGATLGGPDWRARPIPYTAGAYNELEVAPVIGTRNDEAAFEYGDGRLNVKSYRRAGSFDGAANAVYSLPPGFPDNALGDVIRREDPRSRGLRGLLEAVVAGDLPVDSLRGALLDHHLAVRANGRQTVTFEPTRDVAGRLPRFGVDFNIGDTFPFRATITRGRDGAKLKRINAIVRLYSYGVTVDAAGEATPAITIQPT